jgi:hypothetical protein
MPVLPSDRSCWRVRSAGGAADLSVLVLGQDEVSSVRCDASDKRYLTWLAKPRAAARLIPEIRLRER